MTHADEHITDVGVWRLRVGTSEQGIVFAWDYPGATLLEVRILRSERRFAGGPKDAGRPAGDQSLVYQGETGSFRDRDVRPGATYWYTLYARHGGAPAAVRAMGEEWTLWARHRVRAARPRAPRLRAAAMSVRRLLWPRGHRGPRSRPAPPRRG